MLVKIDESVSRGGMLSSFCSVLQACREEMNTEVGVLEMAVFLGLPGCKDFGLSVCHLIQTLATHTARRMVTYMVSHC